MSYAAGGYQVICDGIVGPWFIDVFRTAAAARAIPLHYVVLTDPEPVRSLHAQFTGIGTLEGHVLDSTRRKFCHVWG